MTNLEHILTDEEYSGLREMSVMDFVRRNVGADKESGKMMLCSALGCTNCRFCSEDCTRKVAEWLNEEYQEPLPFPINTVLETEYSKGNFRVFYYKGKDKHGWDCGSFFREEEKGCFKFDITTARKVGE